MNHGLVERTVPVLQPDKSLYQYERPILDLPEA